MRVASAVALAVLTSAALILPAPVRAAGPPRSGSMQAFVLTPSARPRPNFHWTDQSGNQQFDLSSFAGKVVLLNFWASWCNPCLDELPTISKLQKALGGTDFTVVGISVDQAGSSLARRMLRKLKIKNLEVYLDRSGNASRAFGAGAIPTTLIFDREGRELGKYVGSTDWASDEAVELIKFFIDHPGYGASLPVHTTQN
jgi:thiol-disulfide isomerase/thioredoxin